MINFKKYNNVRFYLILLAFISNGNLFSQSTISQAEYFIDTDPGFGNANTLAISSGNSFSLNNVNIVTQNLASGIHFLYVRCKDANNRWSIPVRQVLYVNPNLNTLSATNAAEYYIDTDPGFGSGNAATIASGNSFLLNNFNIATQNLTEGIHFLYVRSKNANNRWSVPVRNVFYVNPNLNAPSATTAAEYFIDTDPGFGNANSITVTAGNTFILNNYNVVTENLSEGIHFLYIRCKNANNKWSVPVRRVLYVSPNLNSPSPIIAAEYFIDTDPGFDLGSTIPITQGNIVQTNFDVITNGLSVGTHFLYVRVKNQDNIWSVASRKLFTVDDQLSVSDNLTFDIKIYPNPTSGIVSIYSQDNLTIDKIDVLDVLGKTVAIQTENTSQVDISDLANGMYVFKIYSGETIFQKKIMKR